MSRTTDEQAINALRSGHEQIAEAAPEPPTWATIESQDAAAPSKRRRPGFKLAAGFAVLAGVLTGVFVVAPWFQSSGSDGEASSMDLPAFIGISNAVVETSGLRLVGSDRDVKGPMRVYEADVVAVHYQDEKYGEPIVAGEPIRVSIPADWESAKPDLTTDEDVGLVLTYREALEGELVTEWRLQTVFDTDTGEFVVAGSWMEWWNNDLRAFLPDARIEDLAAWAHEADEIADGRATGPYAEAWEAYQQRLLDERGVSWIATDPRMRSLDPSQMPEQRREDVVGVEAVIEIPDSVASEGESDDIVVVVRSEYGVVHAAALSVGTHQATLWGRSGDDWEVVVVRADGLDGITIGTIGTGNERDGEAMLVSLDEAGLREALGMLDTDGTGAVEADVVVVEPLTRSDVNDWLARLAG